MSVTIAISSIRHRTKEFQSVVERLNKWYSSVQNGTTSSSRSEDQRSMVSIQSEFSKRAFKIGLRIHQTSIVEARKDGEI